MGVGEPWHTGVTSAPKVASPHDSIDERQIQGIPRIKRASATHAPHDAVVLAQRVARSQRKGPREPPE